MVAPWSSKIQALLPYCSTCYNMLRELFQITALAPFFPTLWFHCSSPESMYSMSAFCTIRIGETKEEAWKASCLKRFCVKPGHFLLSHWPECSYITAQSYKEAERCLLFREVVYPSNYSHRFFWNTDIISVHFLRALSAFCTMVSNTLHCLLPVSIPGSSASPFTLFPALKTLCL